MTVRLITGDNRDVLRTLPDESVHCVVTSPPYWGLRDYGVAGQIGLEASVAEHIDILRDVFREVRRVLRKDGTCWVNYGDAYAGGGRGGNPGDSPHQMQRTNAGSLSVRGQKRDDESLKPKDLIGLPWRLAFALQADGWWLRSDIIWSKPNPMPESVTDRPTRAHEYVFLLTKAKAYWYDAEAVREGVSPSQVGRVRSDPVGGKSWDERGQHSAGGVYGIKMDASQDNRKRGFNQRWDKAKAAGDIDPGRNARTVWEIATQPFSEAHFATFPPALAERCIKAGCPVGGTVLDPFGGAGTTGLVADRLQRNAILIELNPEYAAIAERRIHKDAPLFAEIAQ